MTVPTVQYRPSGEFYEINVKFRGKKEWSIDKLYEQIELLLVSIKKMQKHLLQETFDIDQIGKSLLKRHDP